MADVHCFRAGKKKKTIVPELTHIAYSILATVTSCVVEIKSQNDTHTHIQLTSTENSTG